MTRPLVLITTASKFRNTGLRRVDSVTGLNYAQAVVQAGGLPMLVSNVEPTPELIAAHLEVAQGIIFSGGADIDPSHYGQTPHPQLGLIDLARDAFELELYRAARLRGVPVLGVCRGIQLINVAHGGSLHQHLPALEGTLQHEQRDINGPPFHRVKLEAGSSLARALGATDIRSNSFHHQAVDRIGDGLRVTGRTEDGIVESIEGSEEGFVMGVQWHPEMSFERHPQDRTVFEVFMDKVKELRAAPA